MAAEKRMRGGGLAGSSAVTMNQYATLGAMSTVWEKPMAPSGQPVDVRSGGALQAGREGKGGQPRVSSQAAHVRTACAPEASPLLQGQPLRNQANMQGPPLCAGWHAAA